MTASPVRTKRMWSPEEHRIALQARSLNFLKIEPLIQSYSRLPGALGGTA